MKLSPEDRALLQEALSQPTLVCHVYKGLQVDGTEHERDLHAQRLAARGLLACVDPVGFRTLPCGGSASRYSITRAGVEALATAAPKGFVLPDLFGRERVRQPSS